MYLPIQIILKNKVKPYSECNRVNDTGVITQDEFDKAKKKLLN